MNPVVTDRPERALRLGDHLFQLRATGPDDAPDVLALHRRVFGSGATEAWYRWKYGTEASQGHGIGEGAWCAGRLVAFCGGLPRDLHWAGQIRPGLQVGDVMVDPDWRGLLTRRGPFFQVSSALYGRAGEMPGHGRVAFGFPNERHLHLALRLALVWPGGPMRGLAWTARPARTRPWSSWISDEMDPRMPGFEAQAAAAGERLQESLGPMRAGQRSPAYLRWRYLGRPGADYRFLGLRRRWARRAEGFAVLSLAEGTARWLDWIGPLDWIDRAAQACRDWSHAQGAVRVEAWGSEGTSQHLLATGADNLGPAAWLCMARSGCPRAEDAAGDAWWWMGGDTDFL